jgi:hypothetical protein
MHAQVRGISERVGSDGLTLLVNPQWTSGNVVSDFGIGPWRRRNEDFVASFEQTYVLKQMRISGDNIRCVLAGSCILATLHSLPSQLSLLWPDRLVRSYPSGWQIYLAREGQASPELLTVLVRYACLVVE